MTARYHHRVLYKSVVLAGILLLVHLLLGCHQRGPSSEAVKVSICDFIQRPDELNGKLVETGGWIYTDIERFGLEQSGCGVSFRWPEADKSSDPQAAKFLELLKKAKRNPFETDGLLFTIVQGRFETQLVRKNGQFVLNGPGYGGGAGSAPSILNVQKAICSILIPSSSTSGAEASKRCRE